MTATHTELSHGKAFIVGSLLSQGPSRPSLPDSRTAAGGERSGDSVLTRRLHPVHRHESLFHGLLVIHRDTIGHFFAHFFDEGVHFRLLTFPAVLADKDDALLLELFVEFIEMRNGGAAGAAPCGPKFDNIDMIFVEFLHGLSLNPFPGLEFRSRITDFE